MTEEKEEATTNNNNNNIILSDEEREKKLIELYFFKGKRTKNIVQELRMSPKTVGKILEKFRNANANRVGVRVGEKVPVYKVGDDNGNGGNGDARSRPLQQQQQAMITMPLPTTTITTTAGLTAAEVKSLSPNEKAAIAYKLYHEMKPYLPSLLRLHNQLKRHGLTNRTHDIDYFVYVMETEAFKLPEFEAELSDMETKVEEARNEFLTIQQEKQKVLYEFQNQKRLLVNDIQSTKKNVSDLKEAQGQIQRTFDFLIHKTA